MLIQTADRVHARAMQERGEYWPRNGLDLWWRAARRAPDRELLALRMLDHWRAHATFHCARRLNGPWLQWFLEETESFDFARVLDRLSVSSLSAASVYRRLRANYSGAAFRVNSATDIALHGGTSDIAALIALGGTNVVDTAYDQSGAGFGNWVASGTARPRITNSGTLDATANGVPTMVFDGSNDRLEGPTTTAFGLSGGPALMLCVVAQWTVTGNYGFGLGRGTNFSAFRFGMAGSSPNTLPIIDINGAGTARRTFTSSSDSTAKHCAYTASMAAGAQVGAAVCTQDGNALAQSAVAGGTNVITLVSTITRWGCVNDSVGVAAGFMNGKQNMLLFFNAVPTGNDWDCIHHEMVRHI